MILCCCVAAVLSTCFELCLTLDIISSLSSPFGFSGTTETCGKIAMSLLDGIGPGERIESHLETITTTGRSFRLIGCA